LLPLPKRRPDEEDTVDAEFLKDMEAPEASDAVIMIQALFRRNKTLAAFLNRSMLNAPLPPAVPRCATLAFSDESMPTLSND
jgi:hypothetical protein